MFDAGTQMTIHQLASSHEHLCTCVGNKEKKREKQTNADITAFSFIFEGPPLFAPFTDPLCSLFLHLKSKFKEIFNGLKQNGVRN